MKMNLEDGILTAIGDKELDKLKKLGQCLVDVDVRPVDDVRDRLLKKLWLLVTTVLKQRGVHSKLKNYDDPVELVDALKIKAMQFELGRTLDGKIYSRTISSRDMSRAQVEHLYDTARKTIESIIGEDPEKLLPEREPGGDRREEASPPAGERYEAEYIRKMLFSAVDPDLSVDARERVLNNAATEWLVGPLATRAPFVEMVRSTAVRVARGELSTLDGRKLLEAQI